MKIHIEIRDGIEPSFALSCINTVIRGGRISGKGKYYCYATMFATPNGNIMVYTRENRKSDCFIVEKEKGQNDD